MRLTVVGCSGSYPGPYSPSSCYLLEAHEPDPQHPGAPEGRTWRILLDLGNGALGALHRYADPLTIDAVFLSHLHADHCLDLCGYHVLRKYHPLGPAPRIPVWGPRGTAARMARAYDVAIVPGLSGEFDFMTWQPPTPVRLGPFQVEAIPVTHPVVAYALRVTCEGAVLAYSGDSGPCEGLVTAARDADLFLGEASFQEGGQNPPDLHLTGRDVGEIATQAGVGRVVLTHIPPWHDPQVSLTEARGSFAGQVHLARAGDVYEVGAR